MEYILAMIAIGSIAATIWQMRQLYKDCQNLEV